MTQETDSAALETAEETLSLLREQRDLYGELESLAQKQRSLISGEEAGPLLALLADRQKLSNTLSKIARRLEPIRRSWSAHHGRLTTAQRGEADKLLAETQEAVRRVIERDEEDARLLAVRKEAAARALSDAHAASEAISAYRVRSDRPQRLDHSEEDPS